MDAIDKKLIRKTVKLKELEGVYTLRKNSKSIKKNINENIDIKSKKDKDGIDIFVKENVKNEKMYMPVIVSESGLKDKVYNDFYIGKNSNVHILAGCSIHNNSCKTSGHDGVHTFYLEENSKLKYVENHYGDGEGEKVLNPVTNIYLKKNATMEVETYQLEGVDDTNREMYAKLEEGATLIVNEKIFTSGKQKAITNFKVDLDGENSKTHLISRSVATESSFQEFNSEVNGNNKCYGHIECDGIIKDDAKVKAIPAIIANTGEANLVHEAVIGKIAGEQLIKLMTLGLTEKQAEDCIIKGFLK